MTTVKVVDSTFSHNRAIGYAGENAGKAPLSFTWDTSPGDANIKVWTDIRLKEAIDDPTPRKIAWLLEPPVVNPGMYEWVAEHQDAFAYVLTHQWDLANSGMPFLYYPFGGSWIREWQVFPKTNMISMLVSGKNLTEAHRLRHKAATIPQVETFGAGVGRHVKSKAEALRSYCFAVVIENGTSDIWFTEKLLDCLSQGTIPIYRGCSQIGKLFDTRGMILWQDLSELEDIVRGLTMEDYRRRIPSVVANLRKAAAFRCPEDWVVGHYPGLLF